MAPGRADWRVRGFFYAPPIGDPHTFPFLLSLFAVLTVSLFGVIPMSRRLPGFTLVELLAVIAIIGMLIALLLPAVQAARESGRRAQCSNNLRQVGLAAQLFENNYSYYPVGKMGSYSGAPVYARWSVHAQLLPFLEQSALNE